MSLNIDRSERFYLLMSHLCLVLCFRIIAEGVPESQTRAFNKAAQMRGVGIIGPATVGGIKVGFVCKMATGMRSSASMLDLSFVARLL